MIRETLNILLTPPRPSSQRPDSSSNLTRMAALSDAIDQVRPCVIQVLLAGDGIRPLPVGTGFICHNSGLVLTARHVTQDAFVYAVKQGLSNSQLLIGLAQANTENMRANFTLVGGEVVEEDARHDLALLRMVPNPFDGGVGSGIVIGDTPIPLMFDVAATSPERPRDGTAIAVSGYPLSETVLITTSGVLASAWGLDIKEEQLPGAPAGFTRPDIKDSYLADVSVNPGNSGGPVYRSEDGVVIGVCVAFKKAPLLAGDQPVVVNGEALAYNSGLSVVIPIVYGQQLLDRHKS